MRAILDGNKIQYYKEGLVHGIKSFEVGVTVFGNKFRINWNTGTIWSLKESDLEYFN